MSFIKSILTFLLIIAIAGLCILNTQVTNMNWSPVHNGVSLPLYAIILSSMLTGFVVGSLALWVNSGGLRKQKRQQKKQIKTLEKELSKSAQTQTNQKPPSDFFPALPNKKQPQ
ncbi:MAG: lipopolysaccharide assembly protein LapA domain-containing protein [Bdellovibrionales bacterium]